MWITNGCVDDKGTPAARCWSTRAPGEKNGQPSHFDFFGGKTPGYVVGQKIRQIRHACFQYGRVGFDHCESTLTGLLCGGDSLKHMMRNLEIERPTLAAMSVESPAAALKS